MKVCPVVIARRGRGVCVLAFDHPTAGRQLVKGGIRRGETALAAARRELFEESGLRAVTLRSLGRLRPAGRPQPWLLVRCTARAPAGPWSHATLDDHGHVFRVFWHPLSESGRAFAPPYRSVLKILRRRRPFR